MSYKFYPDWYNNPPPARSYRSIFKWGSPSVFKHPNERLLKVIKDRLGMKDEDFKHKKNTGDETVKIDFPVKLNKIFLKKLEDIVGSENVLTDDYSRLKFAYGKTMLDLMRLRLKIAENIPDAVVSPRCKDEIKKIIELCDKNLVPITVYSGGSSVTRGVECPKGGISLNMQKYMKRILKINPVNQTVTVQPGISGPELEKALNNAQNLFSTKYNYTCGHFPQSFEYSTVGGWITTRGAGQNSTYYGKIENLVLSQEYLTPAGEIRTGEYPAHAMGPDLNQVMIGSEGVFGILVSATLKIFRLIPHSTRRFSFIFKSWQNAIDATREIMQAQFGFPSIFRLSDPEETEIALRMYGADFRIIQTFLRVKGYKLGESCLLIGTCDGDDDFTKLVSGKISEIASDYKAMSLSGLVAKAWEKSRFKDPYMRDDFLDFGIIVDTLECSACWDRIEHVWKRVTETCKKYPRTICMAHISHFYPQGANLYFTFFTKEDGIKEYLQIQNDMIGAIRQSGASLSHHHGIGKMIAPWFEGAVGKEHLDVLKALKKHFDPNNIMNPGGTLALDIPETEKK